MKKLCWTLIVLAVGVVGLGFYRGWFVLSSHSRGEKSHKVDVNLTVDQDKMKQDGAKVREKTKELTGQGKE